MSKMTNTEYEKYVDERSPKSPILKNILLAFLVGGLICVLGQSLGDIYKNLLSVTEATAKTLSVITLIFLSALLTGLHLYDDIAKFAGAGIVVPITGFANSVVSPAMEFKSEGLVIGLGGKMFAVAGPVLAYGISSSVIYGLILLLFT